MPLRSRTETLLFYGSLLGEVVAWIALALAILVIVFALNPARGGVVEASFIKTQGVVMNGGSAESATAPR